MHCIGLLHIACNLIETFLNPFSWLPGRNMYARPPSPCATLSWGHSGFSRNNGSNETSKDMQIHLALKSGVEGEALWGKAVQMCEIRKWFSVE